MKALLLFPQVLLFAKGGTSFIRSFSQLNFFHRSASTAPTCRWCGFLPSRCLVPGPCEAQAASLLELLCLGYYWSFFYPPGSGFSFLSSPDFFFGTLCPCACCPYYQHPLIFQFHMICRILPGSSCFRRGKNVPPPPLHNFPLLKFNHFFP